MRSLLRNLRRLPLDAANLRLQSLADPPALPLPEGHTPDAPRIDSELASDSAVKAVVEGGTSQVLDSSGRAAQSPDLRGILQGQDLVLKARAEYTGAYIEVKKKRSDLLPSEYSARIKDLRKKHGLTQTQLAEICTVTQTQISRYEAGIDNPPPATLVLLGKLAGDPDKAWWWERAGVQEPEAAAPAESEIRRIPLLKDPAAAGTPRAIDEREIEAYLPLPTQWIGRKSSITAIKVVGDSMTPILDDGYIVLVDTSVHDARKLVNHMVAARAEDGVTIKWLRKERVRGEDMYLLVPNHASVRHQVRVIVEGSDQVSIVGKVVKWIGEPPPPRK